MTKLNFVSKTIQLKGRLIRFDERPYLPAIYASCGNLVLRASRQVEKSTFLCNTIIYEALANPGIQILFVAPRDEQARMFFRDRFQRAIEESPLVRRALLGTSTKNLQLRYTRFRNGSTLYFRSAFRTADAARGISADILMIDEFQDMAGGDLPVLQETLSHSNQGRTILAGTPKLFENHLEAVFSKSTANEWTIACSACARGVILDLRSLGPSSLVCPDCRCPIDVASGRWIPRNPHSEWGDGFWINHLMANWVSYDEVLQKQYDYDPTRFKNEVLGLPTSMGEHIVTREEMEACCEDRAMAKSAEDVPAWSVPRLVAGIDWGGGGTSRTVIVVGFMRDDFIFEICHLARFRADEDPNSVLQQVAETCRKFQVEWIAADGGGNGQTYNRLLLDRLSYRPQHLYAIFYGDTDQPPRRDGNLIKWTVNRSESITIMFGRVKLLKMRFPRLEECGDYLDEFSCEIAEYDDNLRRNRYTHPPTQQDDALHATNYALSLSVYHWHRTHNA
jgi:phage terminase large subunit GpA-like protein